MADALIQQESFPDLVGWEDSVQKIASATGAVAALRNYRETQRAEIVSEKEKAEARERAAKIGAEIKARKVDLSKLDTDLGEIAKGLGTKEAGYAFQDWFYRLADFFEVENRKPYVSDGRQIDGSITVEGTTYLVELKFTGTQSDATDTVQVTGTLSLTLNEDDLEDQDMEEDALTDAIKHAHHSLEVDEIEIPEEG